MLHLIQAFNDTPGRSDDHETYHEETYHEGTPLRRCNAVMPWLDSLPHDKSRGTEGLAIQN